MRRPEHGESRKIRFELSPFALVALGVVLLLGLVWVFILGVLLGRGYHPESAVPEIARMMPSGQAEIQGEADPVLKPEELGYMDEVAKPDQGSAPESTPQPAREPAQADAKKPDGPAPEAAANRQQEVPPRERLDILGPGADPASPPAEDSGQRDAPATVDQQTYLYVYQVASFRDRKAADALQDRIRALDYQAGLEEATVNGTTWYRVIVYFRGRPVDTRRLKADLEKAGIDRVLMRTKKPYTQGG
jgi:cell division protein FtsN